MINYNEIKQALQDRKQTVEDHINYHFKEEQNRTLSFSTGELSQYDNHPADAATDLYEREKDFALLEQAERELEEIKHALAKFEEGTFGICEVTGQTIPYERLEANPAARTVVEAVDNRITDERPSEEAVLGGFRKYQFDGDDDGTEFDAEDAYQSVAEFNELPMVFEDSSLEETGELIGYVEQIEGFLSTGIEGYTGDEDVVFQRNVHYDQYLNGK
ncbi:TraR/DksA C4-type zinc finger protein [Halalkalibacter akibai]|uniref:DnaK suppressor protein n=1 Tax=Halalkalibacter akibai (strain ATCC 43226 / DSM 21942 / CIP 109018 / JCM 9157 / 1139) TaxID=1236973 RepID=W4QP71_HALA3|nr:TraR/DksA C4-type zinc finger protein [Halalkalibacter akibai]GAE33876.1 DnaK suppressor protein [Halalkalibacter akibai JCM 9157]